MEINIWSDIRCPFCYIGKRKFETALENFSHKDKVKINWRSFQLDPHLITQPGKDTIDYFTSTKGVSREQAEQMFGHATQMAADVGLKFQLAQSVAANSFNAHRLIQLAKTKDLGDEMEEALFKAQLTELKNIDDMETLTEIAVSLGMNQDEVAERLASDAFEHAVKKDEMEARSIGVQGVPFFVFNNKHTVSGAQSPEVFLQTLEKAWTAYEQENPSLVTGKESSCSTDGSCD